MRKALLTAALISGLVMTTAAPAAAAPPDRQKRSGESRSLDSFTSECTQGRGAQICTDIQLHASTDTDGQGSVHLDISTYSFDKGQFTPIANESGFLEGGADLVVTDALDATLAPTPITLQSLTCTPEGCEVGDGREVIVSASDSAAGPVFTSRDRGMFRDGTCMFKYSSRSTGAPVEGTITIDGVTYAETGTAQISTYRVMERCK